jgi:hypothetical protein
MKIGAENKKKVWLMVVLLVIAIPLVIYSFSTMNPSSSSVAAAPQTSTPAPAPASAKKTGIPKIREGTLDPTLRTDILLASQKIDYAGGKRNIFIDEPLPPPKPVTDVRSHNTPQPPPLVVEVPKPAMPLKYDGFSSRPGEPKKAFLQNGENIFVAGEGDVVDRRYRILKITNNFVLVEDVLNNYQQTITLTPPQAG